MKRRAVLASVTAGFLAGCTGPAADGGGTTDAATTDGTMSSGATTGGDGPAYEKTDFAVRSADCGGPADEATVAFDENAGTVAVEGTIGGSNACYTAKVADATYDASADEYRLVVESVDDSEPDEACADCLVEIDYEATATFNGGLPGNAVVVHRGSDDETEVANASP